jgi:MFS family permease
MPDVASGLRGNRNWLRLLVSQSVALFGFHVFNVTITLWIATEIVDGQTWAPAAVGGVLACAAAPVILVGPIAGVYADRWDSRRTMMATDILRAAISILLILLPMLAASAPVALQLALIYLAVTTTSICTQFFMPARFGLVAAIIHKNDQSRAMSLLQSSTYTAAVLGPLAGAVLFSTTGAELSLIVHATALIWSYLFIRAIATPQHHIERASRTFMAEFREGLRHFVGTPALVVVVVAGSISMLGLGMLNTLNVFFIQRNLGVDPGWLGGIAAGLGIGSIAGALLAAWFATRFGEERFFWIGLLIAGVALIVYSRLTSLPVAIIVIAMIGLPIGAINAVMGPLVLRTTPKELLGRMLTVINPSLQTSSLIGMALSGALASTALTDLDGAVGGFHIGPYDTIFTGAGVLLLVGGVWAMRRFHLMSSPTSDAVEQEMEPTDSSTR